MCPWCEKRGENSAMRLDKLSLEYNNEYRLRCPKCRSTSMTESTEEALYVVAPVPSNPPLTKEQLEALDDLDVVWVDEIGCKTYVHSGQWAKDVLEMRGLQGYHMFKWFARKPTAEDIRAANKGGWLLWAIESAP